MTQAHAFSHPHLRVHERTDITHARTRTTCRVRGQSCLPISLPPLSHTREIHLIPERYKRGGGRREAPPNLSLNPEARRHYELCLRLCHYILTAQVPPPPVWLRLYRLDRLRSPPRLLLVVRPADSNAHFGSERLHRAEEHVRGKMLRMPGPLRAVLAVCVGNFYLLFGDKERSHVACISEGINHVVSKQRYPLLELTHSRMLHTRPRLHVARVGLTTLTMPCRFH